MMTKVNYKKEYQEAYILVPRVKIQEVKEKNTLINEKFKTVFVCESKKKKDGVMCIFWGKTKLEQGDIVQLKGRFKGEVFIARSLKILQKIKTNNTPVE